MIIIDSILPYARSSHGHGYGHRRIVVVDVDVLIVSVVPLSSVRVS